MEECTQPNCLAAADFLTGIRDNKNRILALMDRRDSYYQLALRGASFSDVKVMGGSTSHSKVENMVLGIVELESQIAADIEKYTTEIRLAEDIIKGLEDKRCCDILRYRYLNGWGWNRVARVMNYERTQIWRIHGVALAAFAEKLQHHATSNCVIMVT